MKDLEAGDHLDYYRIGQLAARGGMASIYRATDLRTGEHVALKIPHPEAESDSLAMARFQNERQICRDLDHPGVVRVFPPERQSRKYLVMEWIDGRTLRDILGDQHKIASGRAVRITLSLCDALEYIHVNGISHGDLKPENIIVDGDDQIKLIDFGIARELRGREAGALPGTGGTVDYISPEQLKGRRGDARSDIYAIGVILYEMLTGETPFCGDTPLVAMHARLVRDPAPIREVPPALEAVVSRALQRDPGRRYSSAGAMAFDLTHPGQVRMLEQLPFEGRSTSKKLLLYSAIAAIPGSILGMLLYVAGHQ